MTTETALFPVEPTALPLPLGFSDGSAAQVVDGVAAWFVFQGDDSDYRELYVHTHDEQRARDVAARLVRDFDTDYDELKIAQSGWCLLITACGCTEEQHAGHGELDAGCEDDCDHPELPPCNSDPIYSWVREESTEGTPGALPYLRIELS